MAKRYIIEELQATHWSVRLRDPESGEVIEVPLEPGAPWPGKIRTDATTHDGGEAKADDTRTETRAPEANRAERPTPAANRAERPAAKKVRKDKGNKGAARVTAPAELKEVMSSPALRSRPIDEDTVSAEDVAAFTKMQTMLRRARGRRAGKRGELGWDETTDAGRSGLIARFNSGAFKILHAGGDTYALFFEWDDGRYDRLACGAAEDLMNLANERAQSEPPQAPPSHLSLELARLYCGTPEQRASASERLEPVLEEVRQKPPSVAPKAAKPVAADPTAPNEQMDSKLTESLKRALADLDAREAKERAE